MAVQESTSSLFRRMRSGGYDLTGERFGRLIVIDLLPERHYPPSGKPKRVWLCLCDCGKQTKEITNNLCMGRRKSCGCATHTPENKRKRIEAFRAVTVHADAGLIELFGSYRRNAKKRGHVFALTVDRMRELLNGECYYCGDPPQCVHRKTAVPYAYNGIDRVDNDQGYTDTNTVSCCVTCNRFKMKYDVQFFLAHVAKIHRHQGREV